jgi:ureidoglycolate lyase
MTSRHQITAGMPDEDAFRPFGEILTPPDVPGGRLQFGHWLVPSASLALQCHLNSVAVSTLPLALDLMERHPHAAQIFLPLDVSRYLVTVMPADDEGRPDPKGAISMILPGTLGIVYRQGVWHAPITVLDRDGYFAVMMQRGAPDDDEIVTIPPFTLTSPQAQAQELAL